MADEKDYCNDCEELKETSSEFYINGVTDNVCDSLHDNTGFDASSGHNNCHDLHLANNCLIKTGVDEIDAFDVCDWKEYEEMMWTNQYNINEALICWLCGIEDRFFAMNLEIEFQATVAQKTRGFDARIDRKGNFTYVYHDWNDAAQSVDLGNGVLTGLVDYCVKQTNSSTAVFTIKGVKVNHFKYTRTSNALTAAPPVVTLSIPEKGGTSPMNKLTIDKSIDEDFNKYVEINKDITVKSGETSSWLNVMYWFDDMSVADDEFYFQIRFINNNRESMPGCE